MYQLSTGDIQMSDNNPNAGEQVLNAVKFVANTSILPGSSQLIEGKVGAGLAYGVAGLAAKTVFGPWLWVGIGLDSYSKSASGKHLWELFGSSKSAGSEEATKTIGEPV